MSEELIRGWVPAAVADDNANARWMLARRNGLLKMHLIATVMALDALACLVDGEPRAMVAATRRQLAAALEKDGV